MLQDCFSWVMAKEEWFLPSLDKHCCDFLVEAHLAWRWSEEEIAQAGMLFCQLEEHFSKTLFHVRLFLTSVITPGSTCNDFHGISWFSFERMNHFSDFHISKGWINTCVQTSLLIWYSVLIIQGNTICLFTTLRAPFVYYYLLFISTFNVISNIELFLWTYTIS